MGYMGKITFNPRLVQVKITLIGEASVPKINNFRENCYNVCGYTWMDFVLRLRENIQKNL